MNKTKGRIDKTESTWNTIKSSLDKTESKMNTKESAIENTEQIMNTLESTIDKSKCTIDINTLKKSVIETDVYKNIKEFWNGIFKNEEAAEITANSFGKASLDFSADFVCEGADTVLDFGCGNGSWLFKCALRGTKHHIGIDLSNEAIDLANRRKIKNPIAEFEFHCGGVQTLELFPDACVDSVIVSNVLDNLMPEDANQVAYQVHRILKPGGKILIKLNPYINKKQINEWGIAVIEGDLLDDGLYLWNQTTKQWRQLLSHYFIEAHYKRVFYKEQGQYNRLFLMYKTKEKE